VDEFLLIDKPSIGEFVAAREQHHGCKLSAVGWRWATIEHEEGTCETLSLAAAVRGESFAGESTFTKYMVRADEIVDIGNVHVSRRSESALARAATPATASRVTAPCSQT
jgi:hypothetical protein